MRFSVVIVLLALAAVAILFKTGYIMTMERDFGARKLDSLKVDSILMKPTRGRILSSDGQLLASSLPEYKIFIDFKTLKERNDSLFKEKLDSISEGLSNIFNGSGKSAGDFKKHLMEGYEKNSTYWPIYAKKLKSGRYAPIAISYTDYKEVKQLPVLRLNPNRGGFTSSQLPNRRKWPFGSLARRTLGNTTQDTDSATSGLELAYDSILRGKPGYYHRQRVRNSNLKITDVQPENGCDLVTTIDVSMQDICEKALKEQMNEIDAYAGTAVLMEVKTGDIKAIVNMDRADNGVLYEGTPHAISDLMEPGSTFKTASIMVALDDDVVPLTYTVNTGAGLRTMHGATMRDHNWRTGGYGTIDVPHVLMFSSNIGTSVIIDTKYADNPGKYVDGLYRIGIAEDLKIPLKEYKAPRIRHPKTTKSWWKTTLPWMSIGYETQISPMNTLAFYNAIANDGTMMRPRFVKQVEKDGRILHTYEPEIIKEQICRPEALEKIQNILVRVVNEGVAKKAGSKQFQVAGKTGTAQVAQNGGYHNGTMHYLVSFCGYFPAEAPKYTCIVAMRKRGTPASGGSQCGPVFKAIAERVYAKDLTKTLEEANDTLHVHTPQVMGGDLQAAEYLLNELDVKHSASWKGKTTDDIWGNTESENGQVKLQQRKPSQKTVPNVIGMGAKDAVYLLESRGLRVKTEGKGKVQSQSIAPGTSINKDANNSITLKLAIKKD